MVGIADDAIASKAERWLRAESAAVGGGAGALTEHTVVASPGPRSVSARGNNTTPLTRASRCRADDRSALGLSKS